MARGYTVRLARDHREGRALAPRCSMRSSTCSRTNAVTRRPLALALPIRATSPRSSPSSTWMASPPTPSPARARAAPAGTEVVRSARASPRDHPRASRPRSLANVCPLPGARRPRRPRSSPNVERADMTDTIAALSAVKEATSPSATACSRISRRRWRDEPLVADAFDQRAACAVPGAVRRCSLIRASMRESNRVRALVGARAGHFARFRCRRRRRVRRDRCRRWTPRTAARLMIAAGPAFEALAAPPGEMEAALAHLQGACRRTCARSSRDRRATDRRFLVAAPRGAIRRALTRGSGQPIAENPRAAGSVMIGRHARR